MSNIHDPADSSPDREIVISRVIHAPRELVWRAWTEPAQVAQWWGPRGFTTHIERMDLRVGGVWQHVMRGPDGKNYPNKSVFREIVPLERIVFTHAGGREDGPGANFTAVWTFEALEAGRTRLTGRMIFSSKDARDFVIREFGAEEGGRQTLERAAEHVAGLMTAPFVITREFAAPRELVWRAWTERDRLMQWFGPKGMTPTEAALDFRPGGMFHYRMVTPDGREMWGRFLYREIVPPERIVWLNSFSEAQGGVTRHPFSADPWPLLMLTTATFAERDGPTTVTISWVPFDATDEERRTFDGGRESMKGGWGGTLDQLAAHLARG